MTPYELAQKLGIQIDFDPAVYSPLWTGETLHISFVVDHSEMCDESECCIRFLSDDQIFHEIAHILLCPSKWVKEPDYGFNMNPLTGWGCDNSPRQVANQSPACIETIIDGYAKWKDGEWGGSEIPGINVRFLTKELGWIKVKNEK